MRLFLLSGTDIYLVDPKQAATAVWGFIPWRANGDPSVELGDTWNLASGYYVFFPAATRSWSGFVSKLAKQMNDGTNRRFGFFAADGTGIGFLSVSGTGNEQALTIGDTFAFRNIALVVSPIETKVAATLDGETFRITNLAADSTRSVLWTVAPPGQAARSLVPIGDLLIPVSGPTPGTLLTELRLSLADQAALETGPMYFSDSDGSLLGLRYPTFISAQGGAQPINVSAYADPALPTTPTRTYFELTDTSLGTTFSTTLGRQVIAAPRPGTVDAQGVSSRFVLSDRPVTRIGDDAAYYLTPMGSFALTMTGTASEGDLLCAYSATEYFSISSADVLEFVPGHAAYHDGSTDAETGAPIYLSDAVETSWVQLRSTTAQTTYFGQPQNSPLYQDNGSTGGGGHLAYQLAFKPIPVWPSTTSGATIATPAVPMVAYGGVPSSDAKLLAAYQTLESKAINPQRRQVLKSASPKQLFGARVARERATADTALSYSMTPLGLLGGFDADGVWSSLELAISGRNNDKIVQLTNMQDALRSALLQNQIFLVIDQTTAAGVPLFDFIASDASVELAEWFFDLQLQGENPDGVPPILILKLFRDKSIKELVDDRSLWEDAGTFSSDPAQRQAQIQCICCEAEQAVLADPNSPYANFVAAINDPAFAGLIALNTAIVLERLPPVIKALLGGMTKPDGTSNIAAFRAHHVGVMISDTGNSSSVALDASSIFALVDYEDASVARDSSSCPTCSPAANTATTSVTRKPAPRTKIAARGQAAKRLPTRTARKPAPARAELEATSSIYPCGSSGLTCYGFKVIYLRALFANNALTSFAAEVDLTVNNLFAVGVNLGGAGGIGSGDEPDNIIKIAGSYAEHDGAQTYSFVATKTYEFTFADNTYLKNITFDKVQFSATEEQSAGDPNTSTVSSRFAIWGSMTFNKLDFLDMFSFEKLSFADLGIEMSYQLQVFGAGRDPVTSDLALGFSPGNLRFDFGQTTQRKDSDSMLSLLPFKLRSFLYSEHGQSISSLDYFGISLGSFGVSTDPSFNFALIFDLDLGSLGGLVGSLSAFKFSILLGWQPPTGSTPNALVFGVQMPEADGKLELNIEGVLKISIEEFQLKYTNDSDNKLLVLALHNSYMEVLGTRMPPGNIMFDFALFAPTQGEDKIGWIAAFNDAGGGEATKAVSAAGCGPLDAVAKLEQRALADAGGDDGGSKLFKLGYLGVGQRVGPNKPLTNFEEFLAFMRTDFWNAVKSGDYGSVYQPAGGWIVVASFELLEVIGLGFVFYDTTPFYALTISITKPPLTGLQFEITYTKVSDNVGLFFINFKLPDQLRTFEAGAASITLPTLKLSIYTNGDFKIDLGFPANDDWTSSFRVEAFAGPVPVTGSGGFYIAKLSSATSQTFKNDNYDTILAGGFAARLGVGKDFVAGPLKAGVSLTFFGIIEGALGYYAYDSSKDDVVSWLTTPKALALSGQFGVIGELYGSVDFVIIKASVNVRIQASIGVQLMLEDGRGGDMLLYVEASVSVSVKVKINLGLFSISISFSFKASFRFEWKLLSSGDNQSVAALAAVSDPIWNPNYPLQAGLDRGLSTWMTPELTSVWTNPTAVGEPWFVVSLTMEYLDDPSKVSAPSDLLAFETIAAQVVAWALNASLGLASWTDTIVQAELDLLNQDPEQLVGGLDYATLIAGLAKMFTLAIESVPPDDGKTAAADKPVKYATVFPMPPFLGLRTKGRGTDLDYVFADKSKVSQQWTTTELQAYFAQLYTNITQGSNDVALVADDTDIALTQTLFLDWFQALARSTVNALLTQMQDDDSASAKLEDVYLAAVRSGQIKSVAGQMSQFFRSGLRLPQTTGMELPDGLPLAATNPLYALVWQEFPVGSFSDGKQYVVELVGDAKQPWVSVDASWTLLASDVSPYAIVGTSINVPSSPTSVAVLQTGPQAFALGNPITWTPTGGAATSLRPLPTSMTAALAASSPLAVELRSRSTDKAYDDTSTPVPTTAVRWALTIEMVVRKVPLGGGQFLPDTYSLGAADVTTQNAMRELLAALAGTPGLVKSIDLLYQTAAGTPGVVSSPTPKQLFVLRTNTTTQSVPPPAMLAAMVEQPTAVGADTSDPFGFLQILEQSSVTNQTGYFLNYQDAAGTSLPSDLFGQQSFAPVTFLFELELAPSSGVYAVPRFVNAVVIDDTVSGQLYYAQTTSSADETAYVSTAAGAAGIELRRTEPGESSVADQLAQLYSLVAFQVPASTGFIASNLSVPSGPQQQEPGVGEQTWRLFVPLYNLATANQGSATPNRYASIGDSYSIETLIVDAFGNAFGPAQTSVANAQNLYFDDLIALGNWTGVRSRFDFQAWSSPTADACSGTATSPAAPNQLSVYLCPSTDTLPSPGSASAQTTATLYTTIIDQLTAPAVELFVTTNLDPSESDITLSTAQTNAVVAMLTNIRDYLLGDSVAINGVVLTVTVPGTAADLPLVFELQVAFGSKRTAHLSPEVADYPAASRITANVPPASPDDITDFAATFSTAFPAFSLATGPADAGSVSVGAPKLSADADTSSGQSQPQGLWAVSRKLTDLSLSAEVRHYLAPMPLDTRLRSGDVPMPNDMTALSSLPATRIYNDVDLDDLAQQAFAAIDSALGAGNASAMFQLAPDAYAAVAYAREDIANRYADHEVGWLLDDEQFIGDGDDLCQGRDQMAQQMRSALSSAYAVDTIVQTKVTFNQALPTNIGNRLQLFGQMQRTGSTDPAQDGSGGFGLGTARVDIPAGAGGQSATTTFLYGISEQKLEDLRYQEFPLEWAASHLQVFLADRELNYCDHGEAAPPSIWLQLINAFASPPQMGDTIIPLAYREYPTPPTVVTQTAKQDPQQVGTSLADQTRWIYTTTYQAQMLAADEITLELIYNTTTTSSSESLTAAVKGEPSYSLFDALARFQAGYAILQPQMTPITDATPVDVLTAFATLTTQLANNSDWTQASAALLATGPTPTVERDIVTDRTTSTAGQRQIILTPDPLAPADNPWIGDKCITALDPATMRPYQGETPSCSSSGQRVVRHDYTPDPPLTGNFVTHQVAVKGLTTLAYENGNSGIGIRRNASLYPDPSVLSNTEFIYQTPLVVLTNPVTPFVDNSTPVAIYPSIVPDANLDLGDYVRKTLAAMLGVTDSETPPLGAEAPGAPANRRLKIDARYGFPIGSPSGSSEQTDAFVPLAPAVLVRSFDLPVDGLDQALHEWVGQSGDAPVDGVEPYAAVLANWLARAGIPLGQPSSPDAPPRGAMLVLDVTLYSQLQTGSNQVPLLRLSQLCLPLAVVAAPVTG